MVKSYRILAALSSAALSLVLSLASLTAAATVPAAQLTSALHWRSVGPYLGGRVTSLAGVPAEPSVFYMATAGGGVWETKDYGHNWKNISDKYFQTGSIGAIAIAPSNAKVIYAGTGDPAIRNTFLTGDGMYKSTDAGKTWSRIGLDNTEVISWIIVDPSDPDVVYVAAMGHIWAPNPDRGVFKTVDGGKSWKKILYVNQDTGAITLAMDPKDPQVLYAAMWQVIAGTGRSRAAARAAASTRPRTAARTGAISAAIPDCRAASSGKWGSPWRRPPPMSSMP